MGGADGRWVRREKIKNFEAVADFGIGVFGEI